MKNSFLHFVLTDAEGVVRKSVDKRICSVDVLDNTLKDLLMSLRARFMSDYDEKIHIMITLEKEQSELNLFNNPPF